MRTKADILALLPALEHDCADAQEDQDLDFKEWIARSREDAVRSVVEAAVCFANGGGGTVVFGVKDKVVGRARAILGVPPEVDVNRLKKAVYDSTDPRMTPIFEELEVPEGTGRLLLMHVYPSLPPYTDTSGGGKVRVGKQCLPLTGTLRRKIGVETGESDFTSSELSGEPSEYLSAAAMERLREEARREKAPEDLLRLIDLDLLANLNVLRKGRLTVAGLLLAGSPDAIRRTLPGYSWTHLRMVTDTDYSDRADGRDALPVALGRIVDRVMADNPITTVVYGMYHFEYRAYPEIALREALLNALCHADHRIAAPILIKQYRDKIELSNPGGFIAGISPENILHHGPAARNPGLVEALAALRLVNRSSLGIGRMFKAMLSEGKEPPILRESGESVTVTFLRSELNAAFLRGRVGPTRPPPVAGRPADPPTPAAPP